MYVTVIQKVSVPPEALVRLFDGCKSLVLIKSLHFFLRTLLLSAILLCIKSKHFWYAYSRQQNHLDVWEFWIVDWIYILIKWLDF